jgi:acetylornithine deacetylase
VAKLAGTGGRSLLLNGHFDTVPPGPLEDWTHSPWSGAIVGDQMIGRGACDMKGGLAAGLAVLSGLVHAGIPLAGDVLLNSVPYEEFGGVGTVATVRRGYRADAAITLEPSGVARAAIGTRGLVLAEVTVDGRSAHAELPQPHFSEGGGVNAIDKLLDIVGPLRRLTDEWRTRPDKQHPELDPGHVMVTLIEGGDWVYTFPSSAMATLNIPYLPADADDTGFGGRVRDEVEMRISALAQADPWLREHPPRVRWLKDFPPAEISRTDPIVLTAVAAAQKHGCDVEVVMNDAWGDFATLITDGQIPSIVYGPRGGGEHAVNEYMSLFELKKSTAILTELVLAWTAGPIES